jgi:hypothetical protein
MSYLGPDSMEPRPMTLADEFRRAAEAPPTRQELDVYPALTDGTRWREGIDPMRRIILGRCEKLLTDRGEDLAEWEIAISSTPRHSSEGTKYRVHATQTRGRRRVEWRQGEWRAPHLPQGDVPRDQTHWSQTPEGYKP